MNAESFNLDHRRVRAPYVRVADRKRLPGGDLLVKYDVRFCQPNVTHLETRTVHAIEHLSAELMRNHTDRLIDFSPMGCRTGFYALMLAVEPPEFMDLLEATLRDILAARQVPGANATQCGWGAHHSLAGAKQAVKDFLSQRDQWQQVELAPGEDDIVPAAQRAELSPTSSDPATVAARVPATPTTPNVDTVVLFAMPEELAPLADPAQLNPVATAGPFTFYQLPDFDSVTWGVVTGIGCTNAAAAATAACLLARPAQLISVGTCGGLGRQVGLGQVMAGASYAYFDADASAVGYEPGQIPRMPRSYQGSAQLLQAAREAGLTVGDVVSGDSFVTVDNVKRLLRAFPSAQISDMESSAIAQVAYRFETPFVALRCVSDICVKPANAAQFDHHVDDASQRAVAALRTILAPA